MIFLVMVDVVGCESSAFVLLIKLFEVDFRGHELGFIRVHPTFLA